MPSLRNSPRKRRHPHLGFSLPRRRTSARTSGSSGGRPRRAAAVAPLLPNEFAMPAKQRLRRNQEHRPALPRQQRAGGGEQHPIPPPQRRPLDRPPQHRQLMSQHRVLHLQRGNARASAEHPKESPHSEVHQEEQHRRIVRTARPRARVRISAPYTVRQGSAQEQLAEPGEARVDLLPVPCPTGLTATSRVSRVKSSLPPSLGTDRPTSGSEPLEGEGWVPVRAMTKGAPPGPLLIYRRGLPMSICGCGAMGCATRSRLSLRALGSYSASRQSCTTSRSSRSPRIGSTARTMPASPLITIRSPSSTACSRGRWPVATRSCPRRSS